LPLLKFQPSYNTSTIQAACRND